MFDTLSQVLVGTAGALAVLAATLALMHRFVWKTGVIVRCKLPPDGTRSIAYFAGDLGLPIVVKEMLVDRAYFTNGVQLPTARDAEGRPPLVLDIGANVGLFAYSVVTHPEVSCCDVISFEIVPQLADLAEANTSAAVGGSPDRRVRVVRHGLGNAKADVEVVFDPIFTAGCSLCVDEVLGTMKGAPLMKSLRALVHDLGRIGGALPSSVARTIEWVLSVPGLNILSVALFAAPVALLVGINTLVRPTRKTKVKAHVERLTDALVALGEDDPNRPIALVKIDVEGAEWSVLEGIDESTWQRIQQIVVEVHDIDGRHGKIKALLEHHGFSVRFGTEELLTHEILKVATVFGVRQAATREDGNRVTGTQ